MKSLIVNITKEAKFKTYVPVETKKIEAYQSYMPIGITKYHSPETRDLKSHYFDPSEPIQ